MFMKTIEERAKEFAKGRRYTLTAYEGYSAGATEQKAIDEEELLKLESVWVKEAQINHDDELNYKQGYHDAIEKAYKWIKANTEGGVHPQNAYGFADRFLKEMEK